MNLVGKLKTSSAFFKNIGFINQLHKKTIFTQPSPLYFKLTDTVCAEPMKKKRKIDPGLLIQKEAKKQRKLEKEIKKLESKGRLLKPIKEYEPSRALVNTLGKRYRKPVVLKDEEVTRRAWLMKSWSSYKAKQYMDQDKKLSQCIGEMNTALQELKSLSSSLYKLALTPDEKLIPFEHKGPTDTPPLPNHLPPDGEYTDITPKFDK